jgi:hypothetical protein
MAKTTKPAGEAMAPQAGPQDTIPASLADETTADLSTAESTVADAPVDPRPGSGRLDEPASFRPLTEAEVAALNAQLALLPAVDVDLFRAMLAQAPIDPLRGQGTLDDRAGRALDELRARLYAVPLDGTRQAFAGRLREAIAPRDFDGPGLRVLAKRDGHRRAGRAWSTAPALVPVSDFSDAQLEQLEADPGLIVERV